MFTLPKIKLMKDTIDELLDNGKLEICERTTFNHVDENGIEYVSIKFHTTPTHNNECYFELFV